MRLFCLLAAALCWVLTVDLADAQSYPTRPLRLIVSVSPGSTPDIVARTVGDALAVELKQPVLVENKSGGSGLLSGVAALAAPADGYTLWLGTVGILMLNPHVLPSMPFDPVTAFQPVGLIASTPLLLTVNPKFTPVKKFEDFVALAKAKSGSLTYGSVGAGSTAAIAHAMIAKHAGIRLTNVPYRGNSEVLRDLTAGEITMAMPDVGLVREMVEDGRLLALGVTASDRSSILPSVPTFLELGYDVNISVWYGVYVRSETPADVVSLLSSKLKKVMADPVIAVRWKILGLEIGTAFGGDFVVYHETQFKFWNDIMPGLGIKESP